MLFKLEIYHLITQQARSFKFLIFLKLLLTHAITEKKK